MPPRSPGRTPPFNLAATLAFTLLLDPALAAAQRPSGPLPVEGRGADRAGLSQPGGVDDRDAEETRKELRAILDRYPPALGRVLKLDPTLLGNQPYLAAYPTLVAFLASHPEIARAPGYYLAYVPTPDDGWMPLNERAQAMRMWENMMAGVAVFVVLVSITGALMWLIRTVIDYRRWLRLSRVQAEVHTKLLDRFASTEDLLGYIQTPAGRRFLESAPIPLDQGPRALGAPLGRILWSVQAGLVLAAGGIGLLIVGRQAVIEVAAPLQSMGVLGLALGAGFIVSAGVAFALSRRLGLFPATPAADVGSTQSAR